MVDEKEQSEFGKGLVICLVKFAEHLEKFRHLEEVYSKAGIGKEDHIVESYMNGASDHLYEIEYPESWKQTHPELCRMVERLQDEGLDLGHGFQYCEVPRTKERIRELHILAREIAVEIDKVLGLEPEMGQW